MTLEENIKSFSCDLDMPYDYVEEYVNRKIFEEIRRRLDEYKEMNIQELRSCFVHNDRSYEESVGVLSWELGVPYNLMFFYIYSYIDEIIVVVTRLCKKGYQYDFLDEQVSKEGVQRLSASINMSFESVQRFITLIKGNDYF
jgi:hypothetical protein